MDGAPTQSSPVTVEGHVVKPSHERVLGMHRPGPKPKVKKSEMGNLHQVKGAGQ